MGTKSELPVRRAYFWFRLFRMQGLGDYTDQGRAQKELARTYNGMSGMMKVHHVLIFLSVLTAVATGFFNYNESSYSEYIGTINSVLSWAMLVLLLHVVLAFTIGVMGKKVNTQVNQAYQLSVPRLMTRVIVLSSIAVLLCGAAYLIFLL